MVGALFTGILMVSVLLTLVYDFSLINIIIRIEDIAVAGKYLAVNFTIGIIILVLTALLSLKLSDRFIDSLSESHFTVSRTTIFLTIASTSLPFISGTAILSLRLLILLPKHL